MSSNLGINPLVPATGFGPVIGFALIDGYPILAIICGICCATIFASMMYRYTKKNTTHMDVESNFPVKNDR
ncbi:MULTISPECIES: hypothetical protein [Bacillus]|uniref:Uncharacterized protein n=1 Tax=Bacillus cereus TaxID=1396 RepID=A0A9X6B626_BACCE|nr:hypothetical protein [Bacillus cereus]OOR72682.1 hypothetical protein BLX06_23515 [Bacillus cereus]